MNYFRVVLTMPIDALYMMIIHPYIHHFIDSTVFHCKFIIGNDNPSSSLFVHCSNHGSPVSNKELVGNALANQRSRVGWRCEYVVSN